MGPIKFIYEPRCGLRYIHYGAFPSSIDGLRMALAFTAGPARCRRGNRRKSPRSFSFERRTLVAVELRKTKDMSNRNCDSGRTTAAAASVVKMNIYKSKIYILSSCHRVCRGIYSQVVSCNRYRYKHTNKRTQKHSFNDATEQKELAHANVSNPIDNPFNPIRSFYSL